MLSAAHITKPPIPPLRHGDRLSAKEFHRRYKAMPSATRAELINGVVYMSSPVTIDFHGQPHCDLAGWLFLYRAFTPGIQAGDNATLRELLGEQEPQPDLCLRIATENGGQSRVDSKGYVAGAPELL